jgi:hypothetical protein
MWAVSILSSAWTQWVFSSKSRSAYQDDTTRSEASKNVKIALPYVENSIHDATSSGDEIGKNSYTNYRPNTKKFPVMFKLRKDSQEK